MGGGWGKQGSGIPLSERVRAGAAPSSSPPAGPSGAPESCPARQWWVDDAVDGHGVKRPGLLV